MFQKDNLVLYKSNPARVKHVGAKIEIELPGNKAVKVRAKDITLLHAGPLLNLSRLERLTGEIEEACEILQGEPTTLAELAELIYGSFSPSSAWAVCELLQDGLYLAGTLESPIVRSREEYEQETKNRRAKAAEKE
ncbi:MAG: RNB domain-containing ribonuclease, partial [Deltaproteobacteria bacterium]|nr:RNB domain-containing ribonuclease [Deltaproteobacteria bacterium]